MFEHRDFENFSFANVPLNRDLFLMSEKWMSAFERAAIDHFNGGKFPTVGYVGYAAARRISENQLHLSWFPEITNRHHEVKVDLPRSEFIACINSSRFDIKTYLFASDSWIEELFLKKYSAFALIDAIGVRKMLNSGTLSSENLRNLREGVDGLATDYPELVFVSFADSILVKGEWQVGTFESDVTYTYEPEIFIKVFSDLKKVFLDVIGLEIYAVITQGANQYHFDEISHLSDSGNHFSLNSLGLPFAQLLSIDTAARNAIKENVHDPYELYIDEGFYNSLQFKFSFEKNSNVAAGYTDPLSNSDSIYFCSDCRTILDNLDSRD